MKNDPGTKGGSERRKARRWKTRRSGQSFDGGRITPRQFRSGGALILGKRALGRPPALLSAGTET